MSGAESMASISSSALPFPTTIYRQRATNQSRCVRAQSEPDPNPPSPSSPYSNDAVEKSSGAMIVTDGRARRMAMEVQKLKEKEARERKEEVNRKIASKKAISVILRREATKAIIEKKRGPTNSKKLLPRTVLEALHERITALRWESALKVFELLREQLWYKPNSGIYIKLIVMLGKCKQPEKAHELFQAMVDEGCYMSCEAYTALLSAYSRSGLLDNAFSILEEMKSIPDCQPDVQTYSILIKSCLHIFAFDKVHYLLSDMAIQGIKPNTVTYNTLIDAYGKAKKFAEMESILVEMLADSDCEPDVWTMNSTLRAFGNIGQIETMERCYEKFQNAGLQPTVQTFNILLDAYGKAEDYEKMSAVMEYMQKYHYSWTIVTYNIVIDAFGRAGDLKQMEYLFRLMRSERIKPSCVTLCSLVKAYAQAGKPEKIGGVLRFIENSDVTLDIIFFNCLVDAYGRLGCLAEMKGVLDMMEQRSIKPDLITYRTMIKAYSANGMNSHVKELRELIRTAQRPPLKRDKPDF
ncbi:pentatricopeptide repeat-containing protein At5g48730, chloroplastic [Neltuma alba]|uniref:pentatricopeptide repeat-containing protein At5g48730, chloroplastic n=1 Tax=Neltuma alba TaxID=207710 RepID=UPI0010A47804|nr:pentatricopeptide repeat-containing protein At5g48730, chloroplastic-like [Prosopis alba]